MLIRQVHQVSLAALGFGIITLSACRTTGPSVGQSDPGYRPQSMACKMDRDPNCVGSATAGVEIPLPASTPPENPAAVAARSPASRAVTGRCELLIEGEIKPRTCEGIRLTVRSVKENEPRTAAFTGYGFKFDDLEPVDYRIEASSDQFRDVSVEQPNLLPKSDGDRTIRVKARPRL